MKVKDQIKVRREQLGISIEELAKRLGVSGQAVRYWEAGRSFPGKAKAADLEVALSMNIDYTEGAREERNHKPMSALIDQSDTDLLLQICRLPQPAKKLIGDLVRMHIAALDGGRKSFSERVTEGPVPSFQQKQKEKAQGGAVNADVNIQPAVKRKRTSTRKAAA